MSESIDLGIDLGTTNSVIARMKNGRPIVITDESSLITPSFVWTSRQGEVYVGRAAKNQIGQDPDNVAEGWKRQLGTKAAYMFGSTGESYSPVDLSRILIQHLLRNAESVLRSYPESAVITIPAAFGEVEKHAVMEAGRGAGLSYLELVQEPVAAGLAYGWDRADDHRPFLIYDIGGGTFDLSLMRCDTGQLVVVGHMGEHTLGGRDIDRKIFQDLIEPKFRDRVSPEEWATATPFLIIECEGAKERLSSRETTSFSIEGRLKSLNGEPINDVVHLSREEIEPLLMPTIDRTVEITKKLLQEHSTRIDDLSGIIMVGGPTRTPLLRKHLEEQFGAIVQYSVDPMTVVAQGAALYSASVLKPTQPPSRSVANAVPIRLTYDPVSALVSAPVGIRVDKDQIPSGTELRITRTDGSWSSGLLQISDGLCIAQVMLLEVEETRFKIEVFSPQGPQIAVSQDEFSITYGLVAAPPPLSRSVGVVTMDPTNQGLTFSTIAKRGDPTPLRIKRVFKTTRTLTPHDDASALEIHFMEGESNKPLRNSEIGMIAIEAKDVDAPLSAGSDIEITIIINPATEPSAEVFIPVLGKTFGDMLHVDYRPPPKEMIEELRNRSYTEEMRLQMLEDAGEDTASLHDGLRAVQRQLSSSRGSVDNDSVARATRELEALELGVDEKEEAMGPQLAMQSLDETQDLCTDLINKYGDANQRGEFERLKNQGIRAKDAHDGELARLTLEAMLNLANTVYWSQDGAWVARFQQLTESEEFTDANKAAYLVREGRAALDAGDIAVLSRSVIGLEELKPETKQDDPLSRFRGLVSG